MITSMVDSTLVKDGAQKIEGKIHSSEKVLQVDAKHLERHAKDINIL